MRAAGSILHAYAQLSRLSNLPTCLTNVLVGCGISARGQSIPWPQAAALTLAVMLIYVAGVALNDVVDAEIDARMRPERPIPSGRISRRAALLYAASCLVLGVGVVSLFGIPALALGMTLAASVVAYDVLHRRTAASLLLMGLCRGLIYPLAAVALAQSVDWRVTGWLAGALTLYVTLLTVVARGEAGDQIGGRRWWSVALPMIVLAPAAGLHASRWIWSVGAAVALVLWLAGAAGHVLRRPPRIKQAVLAWLSGICLADAFFLTLLDLPLAALIALACFGLTALGHRYILGT